MNRINLSIFLPAILLVVISLSTFYSLNISIFKQQLIFLIVSIVFYLLFLNINIGVLSFYSKPIYFIMVFLLSLLFLIGVEAKGATRWLEVFGVNIQFSEIFKPFILIAYATFLTSDTKKTFGKFIRLLFLIFPVFFLTLKQPDLGNAMIYLLTMVIMLFIYGFPIKYFLGLGLCAVISVPVMFEFLHGYQRERIVSFLDYSHDPFGSSYNAIQSTISVGSGELFGKGLGQATQSVLKFLPERHTDFIFATIAESLGLAGSLILITLFILLLYRILVISRNTEDEMLRLLLQGYFFLFLIHVFFNIGMNIGIVPIVGITLPFVSYGGSSLLTNFIILGIISGIGFDQRKNLSMEIK